jgi:hypothetical protein
MNAINIAYRSASALLSVAITVGMMLIFQFVHAA